MKTFNPDKNIPIEIHSNDMSNTRGYTIWRTKNAKRINTLSRNADGKDFDWMTEKQMKDFENGKINFNISASDAATYFNYLY